MVSGEGEGNVNKQLKGHKKGTNKTITQSNNKSNKQNNKQKKEDTIENIFVEISSKKKSDKTPTHTTSKSNNNTTFNNNKTKNIRNISKKKTSFDEDMGLLTSERKQTDDKLPVYSMEELNIGKGGDTSSCPFDCWCCY
eukprot:GHVR01150123.1.p1 GENE.GHVR01150123.1~~GHVR01150123.1.p1  ORF type:complete len:150 (+),score=45.65 GHVR01150123.1:34-450(+)